MNNTFKGHTLESIPVSGQLSVSEFKGLKIYFSYAEPIAIASDTYAIINDTPYSATTTNHIRIVKRMFIETRMMNFYDFEERLERILDGTSYKRWNSYD